MKKLMWGKCSIAIAKRGSNGYGEWKVLPELVESSTMLTTTKGEKKEAKVEGGGVEAVKYASNTYMVETSVRLGMDASGDEITLPFDELDGVVDGTYGFRLQPEDASVIGLFVEDCVISVEPAYTSAEGGTSKLTFDFLKPEPTTVDGKVTQPPTLNWKVISSLTAAENAA